MFRAGAVNTLDRNRIRSVTAPAAADREQWQYRWMEH